MLLKGYTFEQIGKFMLREDVTKVIEQFDPLQHSNPLSWMKSVVLSYDMKAMWKARKQGKAGDLAVSATGVREQIAEDYGESFLELFDLLLEAKELQTLGRLLKINQGMSTNFEELFGYIHDIDSYINSAQKTIVYRVIVDPSRAHKWTKSEIKDFSYIRFLSDETYASE